MSPALVLMVCEAVAAAGAQAAHTSTAPSLSRGAAAGGVLPGARVALADGSVLLARSLSALLVDGAAAGIEGEGGGKGDA